MKKLAHHEINQISTFQVKCFLETNWQKHMSLSGVLSQEKLKESCISHFKKYFSDNKIKQQVEIELTEIVAEWTSNHLAR